MNIYTCNADVVCMRTLGDIILPARNEVMGRASPMSEVSLTVMRALMGKGQPAF